MRAIPYFLLCLLLAAGSAWAKPYVERPEVQDFIQRMQVEHGFDADELRSLFSEIRQREPVLKAIKAPAERKKNWPQYRKIFLTDSRLKAGVKYWKENKQTLAKAQQVYGVPEEIIVAIIGVETYYGTRAGKHPVFESLVTLGFDYPKRGKFFRSELEHFLLLCREESLDTMALKGSYAGAVGIGQFISSSYRHYAVDFDEDGVRDLWNHVDAIGSVGNYFSQHGWRPGEDVIVEASVRGKIDAELNARPVKPQLVYQAWQDKGVEAVKAVDSEALLALVALEGNKGPEYWLGYHNFYVITRYNHNSMYALAVYQLSQEIKQAYLQSIN